MYTAIIYIAMETRKKNTCAETRSRAMIERANIYIYNIDAQVECGKATIWKKSEIVDELCDEIAISDAFVCVREGKSCRLAYPNFCDADARVIVAPRFIEAISNCCIYYLGTYNVCADNKQ